MVSLETRAAVLVVAVAVAIGALPIYAGVSRIAEYVAAGSMESAVDAEVVAAERLWLRELISPIRKREIWQLTYEFRTGRGAVVRATGIRTQSTAIAAPSPGTKLRVRYQPDDPGSSYVEDVNRLFDAAIYLGLGLLIWVAAGLVAWWEVRRRRNAA